MKDKIAREYNHKQDTKIKNLERRIETLEFQKRADRIIIAEIGGKVDSNEFLTNMLVQDHKSSNAKLNKLGKHYKVHTHGKYRSCAND